MIYPASDTDPTEQYTPSLICPILVIMSFQNLTCLTLVRIQKSDQTGD